MIERNLPTTGTRFLSPLVAIALAAVALAPNAEPAHAAQTKSFVIATDFSSATLGAVTFGPPRVPQPNLAPICADAVLRYHQGLLYVVERLGCDNIRVLDPANGYAVVRQFSVGNGTNPNDIVLVSPTKAYVTLYESSELAIVDPAAGTVTGAISLAQFADADGIPEMNRMALENGRVFVSVQRVDRDAFFSPTDSSQLVVIDPATDTIVDCDPEAGGVQGILLPAQNPTTEIVRAGNGTLVVGCTGFFGSSDGGIARIDATSLRSLGLEVTEATLGGDVNDLAVASATRGFAVLSDASFNTLCVGYDRTLGTVACPVHASAGFTLSDCEVNDRGELWLCDRSPANPGLRVFDAATCGPLTSGPISVGLPPQDITFDDPFQTVAVDQPPPGTKGWAVQWALAGVFPQPFVAATTLRFRRVPDAAGAAGASTTLRAAGGEAPARLAIFDAAGRRVRGLEANLTSGDELAVRWDGQDASGRAVPAGVYVFRFEADGAVVQGRLVRLGGTTRSGIRL